MRFSERGVKDMVFVPVPFEHVGEVRTLLERLETGDETDGEIVEVGRAEILHRIFQDCSRDTQRMLLEIAKQDGDWIYGYKVAKLVKPEGKSTNTSPYLKSLNVAAGRHLRAGDERIVELERGHNRLFRYRMDKRDAEIIRAFGG